MSSIECPSPLICDLATHTCAADGCEAGCDAGIGSNDASDAPPRVDCWAAWKSGAPVLSVPRLVDGLNTAGAEEDPSLSADALTLYFLRGRTLHQSTRPTRTSAFGTPAILSELQSADGEGRMTTTANGLETIFDSRRAGGEGGADLWRAKRDSVAEPFGKPTQVGVADLNDGGQQFDPELVPDGRRLYYAPSVGSSGQQIAVASRASLDDAFDAFTVVEISGALEVRADPSVSPDELVMVFTTRGPAVGPTDLYFAIRSSVAQPFVATKLEAIDVDATQGDGELADDGCSLIFASTRAGGLGGRDLWTVDLVLAE
jgi:hypothetical protein